MPLLHEHAGEAMEHCTATGEHHLHSSSESPHCFVCDFCFSTFQTDVISIIGEATAATQYIRPAFFRLSLQPFLIAEDHAPRGPPVV